MTQKQIRLKILNQLYLKEDMGILSETEAARMPELIHQIYFR